MKFRNNPQDIPPIDSQQPSMKDDTLGICTLGGCRGYKFLSSANESRHIRLAHGGHRGMDVTTEKKTAFKCSVCTIYFLTQYRLNKHRKESGHKGQNGRPAKK